MTIFEFDNTAVEIELPDKPIAAIHITVISGDETGKVIFDDGTDIAFDASNRRLVDLVDGSYTVPREKIPDWPAYRPSDGRTIAYLRLKRFS